MMGVSALLAAPSLFDMSGPPIGYGDEPVSPSVLDRPDGAEFHQFVFDAQGIIQGR